MNAGKNHKDVRKKTSQPSGMAFLKLVKAEKNKP